MSGVRRVEHMVESAPIVTGAPAKTPKQRPGTGASAMLLREIPEDVAVRSSTGISELDRVLGGGIVEGALMLIGGDPGIGKSTLLLQVCANLCKQASACCMSAVRNPPSS